MSFYKYLLKERVILKVNNGFLKIMLQNISSIPEKLKLIRPDVWGIIDYEKKPTNLLLLLEIEQILFCTDEYFCRKT